MISMTVKASTSTSLTVVVAQFVAWSSAGINDNFKFKFMIMSQIVLDV